MNKNKRELESIKSILDLFLSQINSDGVVSQERIEWELDFRTHLLNEIETLLTDNKCSCGEPHISDRIVHCYDGKPCYVKEGKIISIG